MVNVANICTGSIIGKRHILTATHCLEDEHDWETRIYFYLGDHEKGSGGVAMERDFCWVIHVSGPDKRTKRVIKIENGLYPNYYTGREGPPTNGSDGNVLDVMVVSLKADIVFSDTIKKARIGKPGQDCVVCNPRFKNDCVNKNLHAYGWGKYTWGTVYNVLSMALNIPLNTK